MPNSQQPRPSRQHRHNHADTPDQATMPSSPLTRAASWPIEYPADGSMDQLLSTKNLARRWDCSEKSINNKRSLGQLRLRAVLIGRLVRYRLSDILKFESENAE